MQPLYDVNHVITCNNNTSTYESHASLSVKMSSVLKNIVFCFTFAASSGKKQKRDDEGDSGRKSKKQKKW